MASLLKVSSVLLAAGAGLLATGILLTAGGKAATVYPYSGPNWPALLSLLLGSLVLWLGCIGVAVVLRRSSVVLAGLLTMAGSFALPWLLHAIGVTWWSDLLRIPALAVLVAGWIQLGVVLIRVTMVAASRIVPAVSHRLRPRTLPPYLGSVLIGVTLGLLVYFWLGRWYEPPLTFSFTVPLGAEFEWDSSYGVTAFHLLGRASRDHVWSRAREFLIGAQIKPQLDSFLRQTPWRKAAGSADMDVVKIIPFAIPGAWGSDGLIIDYHASSLMRAPTQGTLAGHFGGWRIYNVVGFVKGHDDPCTPGAGSRAVRRFFVGPFIADP
jgi:hypothetical protein